MATNNPWNKVLNKNKREDQPGKDVANAVEMEKERERDRERKMGDVTKKIRNEIYQPDRYNGTAIIITMIIILCTLY